MQVIVLTGPIGAGKTTVLKAIDTIATNTRVFMEDTESWQFYLERFYTNPSEYGWLLQMEVLHHFQNVTREIHKLQANQSDVTIFVERSPLDVAEIFLKANKDLYDPDTYDALIQMAEKYAKLDIWSSANYLLLDVPPDECMKRINGRDRKGENMIDMDYITKIDTLYKEMASKHVLKKIPPYDDPYKLANAIIHR